MNFVFMVLQITSSTPSKGVEQISMFDLLLKGGYVMLPILFLSFMSVYLFVERFLYINYVGKIDLMFIERLKQKVSSGDAKGAFDYCLDLTSPIAKILLRGIVRLGSPVRDIESSIEQGIASELAKMEQRLMYLSAIATIAPMLGFLGTVIGMIKAFYNISIADSISIGGISGGIYEKMVTSASGLVVGIIAYIFFTILSSKIDKTLSNIDTTATELIDILYKPSV